jgi:3-hydroxymyristoyl/3-hydroxydecanoyl-(acyl carrier protein) dehydratase
MPDHFAAFSFVDRITKVEPGVRARAVFSVPAAIEEFPSCLVAEAVGQLAAWVAMAQIDFRGRPVAALATETIFHRDVAPGNRLDLAVEIESCDDEAVAYGGFAEVDGEKIVELKDCLGPMLPVNDFDSPDAMRERYRLLCGEGAPAGRFHGIAVPKLVALASEPKKSRAMLSIPQAAPFFADHFPRRAVFPATLLLDSQIRLAMDLARTLIDDPAGGKLVPRRMSNVKVRSFVVPGQQVELAAEMVSTHGVSGTVKLSAASGGRSVATARLDIGTSNKS